ncbi:hypothetical protein QWT69_16160 [Sporosarcina oncorhynchi]|uniref:Uncharacterized protein n=1 Tax=Sporosarcina oncorhynchi TaxID=3056444 RepID=A0ABZ0L567_9BACL|nr:hypothetical protein [Sporosarcina sp. T2O-4]WOV87362.1 hypothetical protein QWT69_16160 [Sporosarcina sp. T2O-4]
MQMKQGLHQLEWYHTFLGWGMMLIFLSPIWLFLAIPAVTMTLHDIPSTLFVQLPKVSYVLYIIGYLLFACACISQFLFKGSNKGKLVGCAILLLSTLCIADGSQRFSRVGLDSIIVKDSLWSKKYEYAWEDIEEVVYHQTDVERRYSNYEFHFKDGNVATLVDSVIMQGWRNIIHLKMSESDVKYSKWLTPKFDGLSTS